MPCVGYCRAGGTAACPREGGCSQPAPSHGKLLLNFSGLWLRQEKRGCLEKGASSSLALCASAGLRLPGLRKSLLLHGRILNLWEDGLATSHQWEPLGSIPKNSPAASHQWEPLSSIPKTGLPASYQWDSLTSSPGESFVSKSLQLPGEGAWGVMGGCPPYPVP